MKFLENDMISGRDPFRDLIPIHDHIETQPSTSYDRLIIVHNTPQVLISVEQPIIEVPQVAKNLPEDQQVQELPHNLEQTVEPQAPQGEDGPTLRRSTRERKSAIPSDYIVYLQETDIGAEKDLETFSQALSCKESDQWYKAMKDELDSNEVWDLIELPQGAKAIGCKWVHKIKRDSLGNIERYKARLVAKGFTKKEGINYKETFSPVSKKDSLRIILALVDYFDLELQQMNVKMAFLNGDIEEEVYMKQPEVSLLGKVNIWFASLRNPYTV